MFRHRVTISASDRWWVLGSSNCLCEWEHFPSDVSFTKFTSFFPGVSFTKFTSLFPLVFLSPSSLSVFPGVSFTRFTFLFSLVKNVYYQIHISFFLGVSFTKFTVLFPWRFFYQIHLSSNIYTTSYRQEDSIIERRQPKCCIHSTV